MIESCPGKYSTSQLAIAWLEKASSLLTLSYYIQISTLYSGKQIGFRSLQHLLHSLTFLDVIIKSRNKIWQKLHLIFNVIGSKQISWQNLAPQQRRQCWLYNQGLIPYPLALDWQRGLLQERVNHPGLQDVLILLEHPPVYTLGQGASLEFLKFDIDKNAEKVYRVERGGEVTYHCPGQLVGYPILNLQH